ncbi:MAG: DUF2795 domain-containing protein [Chloroflexi bacterium]|nr:MAG: DUF2795 domain-containing protein [Chloroflexota bacterium]
MPHAVRPVMQEMQANASARDFLETLDYPISKPDILANAREASLAASVQEALTKLPDRDYESPEDVTEGLKTVA